MAHETGGGKERGSLVTLLYKETVNKVIDAVSHLIQHTIADEVREAKMFSVQLDTAQDLTSKDQCAIVLRYVTDVIHERLLAVTDCEASTGAYFVELVRKTLDKVSTDIKNCVGNSTDGAANMQGQYRGFLHCLLESLPSKSTYGVMHMCLTLC